MVSTYAKSSKRGVSAIARDRDIQFAANEDFLHWHDEAYCCLGVYLSLSLFSFASEMLGLKRASIV